jgi:hypothetical protein
MKNGEGRGERKGKKFAEEQIIKELKQAESGAPLKCEVSTQSLHF